MSGRKCKNCGSSDIEVDPGRGDAVCTNCGSVLEDNIIVAEVQFEENAHGASSAIGQFVAADSKGGATNFGASFHIGSGIESREVTLKKARKGIATLCHQLHLNQHCIDTACNFFKMALSRGLTRGRKNTHVYAACVYITCRTEGTAHLLIDISDILQICCYELGRTYLRLTQALCINIPSVDPCLYILRFAGKLEFGDKTHEVSMTALRLVQRMKRDSIHSGRRPSGLCGAALLIAARLHEFSRQPGDIVKIVKVHESTLRKRLIEFGDTPTSALTLEEFMTIDLEEEQDPPSFKAARKRDKERLQKIFEEDASQLTDLQLEIEKQLEKDLKKTRKKSPKNVDGIEQEEEEAQQFVQEACLGTINRIIAENESGIETQAETEAVVGLGPNIESMGLANSLEEKVDNVPTEDQNNVEDPEWDLGIDDAEIDMYIMSEHETSYKDGLWNKVNATYLKELKEKEERLAKEREEGKPEKKRRKFHKRKITIGPSNSAGEAIEKMLQEKKISSKINYDVLKSLNAAAAPKKEEKIEESNETIVIVENEPPAKRKKITTKKEEAVFDFAASSSKVITKQEETQSTSKEIEERINHDQPDQAVEEECEEDYEEEPVHQEGEEQEMGVLQMLRQHREDGDEYYGYDDEEY